MEIKKRLIINDFNHVHYVNLDRVMQSFVNGCNQGTELVKAGGKYKQVAKRLAARIAVVPVKTKGELLGRIVGCSVSDTSTDIELTIEVCERYQHLNFDDWECKVQFYCQLLQSDNTEYSYYYNVKKLIGVYMEVPCIPD